MAAEYEYLECDSIDCHIREQHWVVYHKESGTGVVDCYSEPEAIKSTARLNGDCAVCFKPRSSRRHNIGTKAGDGTHKFVSSRA